MLVPLFGKMCLNVLFCNITAALAMVARFICVYLFIRSLEYVFVCFYTQSLIKIFNTFYIKLIHFSFIRIYVFIPKN